MTAYSFHEMVSYAARAVRRKYWYALLALGVLTNTVVAQLPDTRAPDVFKARLTRAIVTLPHDRVEVPLLEDRTHMPVVEVMINGRGPFRFGLETGAAYTVLGPAVMAAVGSLPAVPNDLSLVDSIRVGDALFNNVVVDKGSFGADRVIDGLFALNTYYDVLLTIDAAHRKVRFTRDTLPSANGRDIFQLHPLDKTWYGIDVTLGHGPVIALLDTRHEGMLWAIPDSVCDSQFVNRPVFKGYGPGGPSQPWLLGRWKDDIHIAGTTFRRPLIDVEPRPGFQGWMIGWKILQYFTIAIDQRHRVVRLAPTIDTVAPLQSYTGFISMQLNGDGTIVAANPVDVAEQQGIKAGDVIVEVNDVPARDLIVAGWSGLASALEGDQPIHMVVRRGTETHPVTLQKTPLVP